MWLRFDKNGVLKEYIRYGNEPIVGRTDFEIYAVFDGLDIESASGYGTASIRLQKPDLEGSLYPILFMTKKVPGLVFDAEEATTTSEYFENNTAYPGFLFQFNNFTQENEQIKLLDTPGKWLASITLYNSLNSALNVTGIIEFTVQGAASDQDETELTLSELMSNIGLQLDSKMDKSEPNGLGSLSINRKFGSTKGENSVAVGYNNEASGNNSFAEGQNNASKGIASHTEGYNNLATTTANYSHVEGEGNEVNGVGSHAEGSGNLAQSSYSHAEGTNTVASGEASHAEGNYTASSGAASHAEGDNTKASGNYSHAQNQYTEARTLSSTALGTYNIIDNEGDATTKGKYAVILGNGQSSNSRNNAIAVDWDGAIYTASSNIYINYDFVNESGGIDIVEKINKAVLIEGNQEITGYKTFVNESGQTLGTNVICYASIDMTTYSSPYHKLANSFLTSSALEFEKRDENDSDIRTSRSQLDSEGLIVQDKINNTETDYKVAKIEVKNSDTTYTLNLPSKNDTLATLGDITSGINPLDTRVEALETKYLFRHSIFFSLGSSNDLIELWIDIYSKNNTRITDKNTFYQYLMTSVIVPCLENTHKILNNNTLRSYTRLQRVEGDSNHVKAYYIDTTFSIVDNDIQLAKSTGNETLTINTIFDDNVTRIY